MVRFYTVSKLGRNTSLNRIIRNTIQCIDQYVEEDNIAKCASAVVRNTIQWEKNFTISLANEKDLHNLFGHRSSVSTFAGVWFSLNNAFSLLPAQTSSIFHAYAANGSGPIAHSPLAVRRKQKSKLGRSEYTRIPRLPMEFNICCLRYETHGHAFFSSFFLFVRLIPHYSFFALVSQYDRGGISRERHDLCLKYAIESNEMEQHYRSN